MATGTLNRELRQPRPEVRRVQVNGAMTDAELLERFAATHEEAAFEALVRRHGPMVLRVCRRVLGHVHDADDAFQATFIVLAQKAGTIVEAQALPGWLHGVAYRIALRTRSRSNRRQTRERAMDASDLENGFSAATEVDPIWRDLRPVLDEELDRLPQEYRTPVVLCYLEGKTNQEAAQQLGCPMGTIASRLSRGRDLLRDRLARRGLALSAGALATAITQNSVSAAVAPATNAAAIKAGLLTANGQTGAVHALAPEASALASGFSGAWSQVKLWGALAAILAAVAVFSFYLAAPDSAASQLLQGHSLPVHAVAFAPDGSMLATGALDGVVQLWDPATGRRRHTLIGHDRGVRQLAFSNDGKLLAVTTWDGAVKVWDVASAKEQATFRVPMRLDHSEHFAALIFSPDDRRLAAGTWHGNGRVWDLATGREVISLGKPNDLVALHRLLFAPDGKTLVGLIHGGRTIRKWDLATGSFADEQRGLENEFPGAFSPDGTLVTSTVPQKAGVGEGGNIVQFWDLASLKRGRTLVGHAHKITQMAFSRDGRTLVTRDSKGFIKVWDLVAGKERGALAKPEAPTLSLALSPDGKRLALGCNDHHVRLLDLSFSEP